MARHNANGLTDKQKLFVEAYLQCFNSAEAARRAGYSEKSAGQVGYLNLMKPEIKGAIEARLAEFHMSADETLARLSEIARGDMGNFIEIDDKGFRLNLNKAKNQINLIKRVKRKRDPRGGVNEEIELYSALDAIDKLVRIHGKYADKLDITSGGEKIVIEVVYRDAGKKDDDANV